MGVGNLLCISHTLFPMRMDIHYFWHTSHAHDHAKSYAHGDGQLLLHFPCTISHAHERVKFLVYFTSACVWEIKKKFSIDKFQKNKKRLTFPYYFLQKPWSNETLFEVSLFYSCWHRHMFWDMVFVKSNKVLQWPKVSLACNEN